MAGGKGMRPSPTELGLCSPTDSFGFRIKLRRSGSGVKLLCGSIPLPALGSPNGARSVSIGLFCRLEPLPDFSSCDEFGGGMAGGKGMSASPKEPSLFSPIDDFGFSIERGESKEQASKS